MAVVGTQAAKRYAEQTKGKSDHNLGVPAAHVWGALCVKAHELLPQGESKETLSAHIEAISTPISLSHTVLICKFSKCYDRGQIKLQICTVPELKPVTDVLFSVLVTEGAVEKAGQAPRGGLEREIQEILDTLQGSSGAAP